jgi:hypothetical protein
MDEIKRDEVAWLQLSGRTTESPDLTALTDDSTKLIEWAKQHIYRTAVNPFLNSPVNLFEAVQQVWLKANTARSHNLHAMALIDAHNARHIDGLRAAITAIEQGGDVFTVARMLADALPQFNEIHIADLTKYCELCASKMGNDLAGGTQYTAAAQWMSGNESRIESVISNCLQSPSHALGPLLRSALVQDVLLRGDVGLVRVHELAADQNLVASQAAIESLGLINWASISRVETEKAINLITKLLRSSKDAILGSSILAALGIVNTSHQDHSLIDEAIAVDRPFVAEIIGNYLGYRSDTFRDLSWYSEKSAALSTKRGSHTGAYRGTDHALAYLLDRNPESINVIDWLSTWLQTQIDAGENDNSVPNAFPRTYGKFCEKPDFLCRLITNWLMHADLLFQRAVRTILDDLASRHYCELFVPREMLDALTPGELKLLARRILGNVARDDHQVAIVWSMTNTLSAETRAYPIVRSAMIEFVGYNYPVATRSHLEAAKTEGAPASLVELSEAILHDIEKYYSALDQLPQIEELKPSAHARNMYHKAQIKAMNRSFEEANKKSLLRQIATTIPLKAGKSSFSMRNGAPGEKMHLSSMSHSVTMPRAESIDPIGSAMQRFHFQMATADDK